MNSKITISKLGSGDKYSIDKIAEWYFNEWNMPTEKTIQRLSNQSSDDIITQAILTLNRKLAATGALCNNVNIYNKHPELKRFKPWVALLFVQKEYRNKGLGQELLKFIEQSAKKFKLNRIYLYTFTAESFYKKFGWTEIERVNYKNHDTVVMVKNI